MAKLTLTCECGQEMLVPESAMGRVGLCPECGAHLTISEANTHRDYTPDPERRPGSGLLGKRHRTRQDSASREDAGRRFATAVDLYNARRFAEALSLLDALLQEYPGNAHIESARRECVEALRGPRMLGFQPTAGQRADTPPALTPELVREVVLDRLLYGDDETRLRAAELAARLLGMLETDAQAGRRVEEAARQVREALLAALREGNGRAPVRASARRAVEPAKPNAKAATSKPAAAKSEEIR